MKKLSECANYIAAPSTSFAFYCFSPFLYEYSFRLYNFPLLICINHFLLLETKRDYCLEDTFLSPITKHTIACLISLCLLAILFFCILWPFPLKYQLHNISKKPEHQKSLDLTETDGYTRDPLFSLSFLNTLCVSPFHMVRRLWLCGRQGEASRLECFLNPDTWSWL